MPAMLIGQHHRADVPTIKQAEYSNNAFSFSLCHPLPVLSTFLMTTATWPFSMELSSLTMRMRQVQRIKSDAASRMRPTARSGRSMLAKM